MADEQKFKYRVLYKEAGEWKIKVCDSLYEANAWSIGHDGSILLRYAVVTTGANYHFDSKEQAILEAEKMKQPWSLINPGFCSQASEIAYRA